MFNLTKIFIIRLAISVALSIIVGLLWIFFSADTGIILITRSVLTIAIVGVWIKRKKVTQDSTSKFFNYYLTSFPLILASLILVILYLFGFNKQQPLLTADMWFVVLASLGAIFVIFNTDVRMDRLETKLNSIVQEKKISIRPHDNNTIKKGNRRLAILIIIAILGGISVVGFANYLTSQDIEKDMKSGTKTEHDATANSTIIAGEITFLGIIFTTIYKEISTYYRDKTERVNKRWNLVLPMIKDNYMPWISAAKSLSNSFKNVQSGTPSDSQINRILFLFSVFYGIRLRNLQQNGGYILLSSTEDEDLIDDAYQKIKSTLNWAGDETPNRVNELQELFVKNEKDTNPYSIVRFQQDLAQSPSLQESKDKLKAWLTADTAKTAQNDLDTFVFLFKQSIKKLSSYWDS